MPIYKDILTKQTKKAKTLQQLQLQQLKKMKSNLCVSIQDNLFVAKRTFLSHISAFLSRALKCHYNNR